MNANESANESLWASEQQLWDQVREHDQHHALIEQAKGMVMFAYGIDADEAFDVLRAQSQNHNVKLRLIAEQVVKDLVDLSRTSSPARRMALDGLMQNAHKRISHSAARQLNGESKTGVPMKDLKPSSYSE